MPSPRALLSVAKTALYRRPKDELQRLQRWGPRGYFRTGAWQRQMEQAATRLPVLSPSGPASGPLLEVWFLTGERFWYQTAFCAWSLARHCHRELVLHLVDDGSLKPEQEQRLRRLFPAGKTRWKQEVALELEQHLPVNRFPVLRQRWGDYINIRKLTDIHLASSGSKLVLDSDMLFFRRP
ncbi:MAG: glycosyl transferase, partial [Cyanobacteriota bacterium]|nr:glycosyl transferase [Cyanobacteriota bacterium]